MLAKRCALLSVAALVLPLAVQAQVFEITRELGAPQHFYFNSPPFGTSATDALPVPAAPNVVFAISGNSTIRLRLVAPAGKKFVASRPVNLSWPGDLNLIPVGSGNSGTLHVCPTSWSFTTIAGSAPVSTVQGYKTDADWLKIRATATSPSSANFEFTEIVLEWNVTGFTGASHTYAMSDGGGWISGPEIDLYETLASGAPDPGAAVSLVDLPNPFTPCVGGGDTWPVCGVPMAAKPGPQLNSCLVADGAGGAFLSYTHADSFVSPHADIWVNHVDANGDPAPGWPVDGFPVTALPGDRRNSRAALDGSGGVFVAWQDTRNDPGLIFEDIYLQHITSAGSRAPGWPVDGLALHPITPSEDEFLMGLVSDGAGGAFLLMAQPSGTRLTRITGSGTTHASWPVGGVLVANGTGQLIADGAGGVYVGWSNSTPAGLRLTRLTGLGAYAGGWSSAGVAVTTANPATFGFDLGGSHVNLAWTTSTGEVRASRFMSSGSIALSWPAAGVLVRSTPDSKTFLTVMNGGTTGELVAVWREDLPAPDGFQVVVQRLTTTGAIAPGWPAPGWVVLPNFSQTANGQVSAFPDCSNGTTLAWTSSGIRALRFTPSATVAPGWPATGVLLCGGTSSIATPNVAWACPDGTGGVITGMPRGLVGSGNPFDRVDIYAQCVRGDGTVDEGFGGGTPVGSNVVVPLGPATVTFPTVTTAGQTLLGLADSGPPPPFGLQIVPSSPAVYYDVTTTAQYTGPVQICLTYDPATVQGPESGLQLLHYDATAMPPAWVDVTTSLDQVNNVICGSTSSLSPFIIVESDPTDANSAVPSVPRLLANVPNPFNPTTTIHYEIPPGNDVVRLEIHDVTGRLVRTLVNARRGPGHHETVWDGQDERGRRLASGIYFYRLRAGSFVATRRMVLLK